MWLRANFLVQLSNATVLYIRANVYLCLFMYRQ
uniref:Uncharacterized protein n=1 Tax=Anguilla anguilla TaxID=7936 RepID=A0A0E9SZ96_ANGAN